MEMAEMGSKAQDSRGKAGMGNAERKYDIILLDVDGTLLDFGLAEKLGMAAVLRAYGLEPTGERLALYHDINEGLWSAFERGEVTKDRLVWERFQIFFGRLGKKWMAMRWRNYTAAIWTGLPILSPGPWTYADT